MSTPQTIKVARVSDGELVVIYEKYFDPAFYTKLEDIQDPASEVAAPATSEKSEAGRDRPCLIVFCNCKALKLLQFFWKFVVLIKALFCFISNWVLKL
ncbi:MAG: hypothetical protein FXV80_04725 [Candidatus Thioglobus sp.]|nr:MAG: hypothetical protein FXV80_04725 [Candidatus Thioglobus sp.]